MWVVGGKKLQTLHRPANIDILTKNCDHSYLGAVRYFERWELPLYLIPTLITSSMAAGQTIATNQKKAATDCPLYDAW